jgi:hypothetical protein
VLLSPANKFSAQIRILRVTVLAAAKIISGLNRLRSTMRFWQATQFPGAGNGWRFLRTGRPLCHDDHQFESPPLHQEVGAGLKIFRGHEMHAERVAQSLK